MHFSFASPFVSNESVKRKGYQNFANKTFANRTFATDENPEVYWRNSTRLSPIVEILQNMLAKVQWTFASCDESVITQNTYESNWQSDWRNSSGVVGGSIVYFRQLVKLYRIYWRKLSGISPLAKVLIGENLIGEIRKSQKK
jgi:hypothetical protein